MHGNLYYVLNFANRPRVLQILVRHQSRSVRVSMRSTCCTSGGSSGGHLPHEVLDVLFPARGTADVRGSPHPTRLEKTRCVRLGEAGGVGLTELFESAPNFPHPAATAQQMDSRSQSNGLFSKDPRRED